ncbi:hypothetical protein [Rhodococcus opacus]|uniref:hypothetical protein n=1 Tax=Rhodococcus opacus TaxID=37919 RepID=UPI00211EAC98|nr:hypothetical protein [Rhodococcus opacus]
MVDEQAEKAMPGRQLPVQKPGVLVDARVDEFLQSVSAVVEHAEGSVSAVDQSDGGVDDPPLGRSEVEAGRDGEHRLEQSVECSREAVICSIRSCRSVSI